MNLRPHAIVDLLAADSSWPGFQAARRYIREIQTRAEARALVQAVEGADLTSRSDFAARSVRVAILGSHSSQNLHDALALQFLDRGLFCAQYHAPFGQLSQEIRHPDSDFYRHRADLILLLPDPASLQPRESPRTTAAADRLLGLIWEDVTILRTRLPAALVLIQNFVPPEFRPLGVLDPKQDLGWADFYRYANLGLSERCRRESGVHVLDAAHLSASAGLEWTSLHKPFFLAGCLTPDPLAAPLARDVAAFAAALRGYARKCLVVDLDNTLWGGVVGEDGVAKVQIGGSFPGNVYAALQRQILSLIERGVILAINSKNDEADGWEPFATRPEMVLRRTHVSAARINWQDKVTNLREITAELNIGLDAVVVLDDSAVERDWIETALPEVYVAPVGDPLESVRWLASCRLFDTLSLTAEDALRPKSYAATAERSRLASQAGDLEAFLHGLELVVTIGPPTEAQLGRLAQLTQKTNQFNLTTRRYSEEQVARMRQSPDWALFFCACRDRFADEGVVGTAFVRRESEAWTIDTFLLSCRVLGRGVERAFLAWLCGQAEQAGARRVRGEFISTAKNGQVATFYRDQGFAPVRAADGRSLWELQLPGAGDMWPKWIRLQTTPS